MRRLTVSAMGALWVLGSAPGWGQEAASPLFLDCRLVHATGGEADVHYQLLAGKLTQFSQADGGYVPGSFARSTCAVDVAAITCERAIAFGASRMSRKLVIDRRSGAIALTSTGSAFATFDAKGTCTKVSDMTKPNAAGTKF